MKRAAAGSALFLIVAPGVMAGVIPWLLTDWHANDAWLPMRVVGVVLIALGAGVLLHAFARFVTEGIGTPAPVAPTEHLVVGGLYRWLRNPMYVAVAAVIVGQALLLARPVLLAYTAFFIAIVFAFVRLYEEPTLRERYGEQYEAYLRTVPGWLPRRP
jgi:protein-S-isoprenylcysteine O-methyltransferase Ste14